MRGFLRSMLCLSCHSGRTFAILIIIYTLLNSFVVLARAADTTPPTAPTVTASRSTTNFTQLSASWTASTDAGGSGLQGYEYKITRDSATGTVIKNFTSTGTVTSVTVSGLLLQRGTTYYFSIRAKDNAGNYSAAGISGGTKAVKFPQVGSISPSSGSGNSNVMQLFTTTYIDQDAWQNLGAADLLISTNAGVYINCCYVSYDANRNVLLLRDDAGTGFVSNSAIATPGSPYILENSYAKLDCAQTIVSGSGKTLTVKWAITFKDKFAGTKQSYLYTRDDFGAGVGWISKGSWTIVDVTPPTGTLKIANDAQYTNTTSVSLAIASSDAVQMKFSNDNIAWTSPEAFAVSRQWTIPSGDGAKTVYMKLKDSAGNWSSSAITDSITLDMTVPAKPSINTVVSPTNISSQTISGARTTDAASIIVTAPNATVGMVAYPTTTSWSCQITGLKEGANSIYAKARDAAGNESALASSSIILDTTPPAGTIKINNDAQYTKSAAVTLTLTSSDSVLMTLSNDRIDWSAPEPYVSTRQWTLSSREGTKTVYMKLKDAVGNWSGILSDTITLDATPPAIIVTYPQNNAAVNKRALTIQYTVDGAARTKDVELVEGANYLNVSDSDAAGNTAAASIVVYLDTTAPVIEITDPAPLAVFDHQAVTVTYTVDGQARSKSVSLTEGVNNLTVTDTDIAGNPASAHIKLYYAIPVVVAPPAGATVYSSDHLASVVIPPDAISSVASISVVHMDVSDYAGAAPENYEACGVVTFLPHGQMFAIPVTITIPLSSAEIPGTEIDLGLLNTTSGLFEASGKLVVNIDGRSATAQVSHFSTYGALKNLVSNGSPVGGGAEIPLPDLFTGSFSHQIKIETPPGRKGIEPNITLLYRSNLRNGWIGYGWDLSPGYIERDTKRGALSYLDTSQTLDFGTGSDGELNVTSGTTIIDGTKNYTRVYIGPDATVTCSPWNGTSGGEIVIKCTGEVKVEGAIDVGGKGYRGGMHGTNSGNKTYSSYAGESYTGLGLQGYTNNAGGGGGGRDGQNCQPDAPNGAGGGGGGYGTAGQAGNWDTYGHDSPPGSGGTTYGAEDMSSFYMGSGGGGGGCHPLINENGGDGGAGGGKVKIFAQTIIVTGTILSNGANGMSGSGGGGGGSGGALWISGKSISIASTLAAEGGNGGSKTSYGGANGGIGGRGRILIKEIDQRDSYVYGLTGSRMDLINLTQNLYQAKIEAGFVKFFKESDGSWRAVQKDGTRLFFGASASSRITTSKGTYRWLLDRIEDTNGNYMAITYAQDGGQSYISTISYTGNSTTGALPTHTVSFILESRTDSITSNTGGETITTAKRLKEIDIKVGADLVRKYIFNYTYSPDTNRSLLNSIDHYGSDGVTKYPSMTFKYRGKQ